MEDAPELTIGEVARRAGVATSSIRYYESIGLLPQPYRISGQRRYGTEVLGRLAFVGIAQSAGFKLEEIKELMRGTDGDGDGMAPQLRELSQRKLVEVEALLAQTRAMKGWLEVANHCSCQTPEECELFADADGAVSDDDFRLRVVHVQGRGCRRQH